MSNYSSSALVGDENQDSRGDSLFQSSTTPDFNNSIRSETNGSNNLLVSSSAASAQTVSAPLNRVPLSLSASNNVPFSPSQYMIFNDSFPSPSILNNSGFTGAASVTADVASSAMNAPARPPTLSTLSMNTAPLEQMIEHSNQYQGQNQLDPDAKINLQLNQNNDGAQMNFYDPSANPLLCQPTREEIHQMEEEIRFQSFLNTSIDEYGEIKPNQYSDSFDIEPQTITSQDFLKLDHPQAGSDFQENTVNVNSDNNESYISQNNYEHNNPSISATGGTSFFVTDYSIPSHSSNTLNEDNQSSNDNNLLQNPQIWQRRRGSTTAYSDISSVGIPSPSPHLSPSPYLEPSEPTLSDHAGEMQSFLLPSDLAGIDQMTSNLTLGYPNIPIGSHVASVSMEFEAQPSLGFNMSTEDPSNQLNVSDLTSQSLNYQFDHNPPLETSSTEKSSLAPEINIDAAFIGGLPLTFLGHANGSEVKLELPLSPRLNSKPTSDLEISLDRDDLLKLPTGRRNGGRRRALSDATPRPVRLSSSPLVSQSPSSSPSSPGSATSFENDGDVSSEVLIKIEPAIEDSHGTGYIPDLRGRTGRSGSSTKDLGLLNTVPITLTRSRSLSSSGRDFESRSLLDPGNIDGSGGGPTRSKSRTRSPSNSRDYILELAAPSAGNKRLQKHPSSFACHLCERRFTRAYNLRSHLRTHTNERPFVCAVCGKAFARQHDRKRHEALHSGERKFQCEGVLADGVTSWGCGRKFARADALGRHFRTDAGRECIKLLLEEEQRLKLTTSSGGKDAGEASLHILSPGDESTPTLTLSPPGDQSAKPNSGNFMGLPSALLQQYPSLMNQAMYWNDSDTGNDDQAGD